VFTRDSPVGKGWTMSVTSLRILVVGSTSSSTHSALDRLERRGWSCCSVHSIAEAFIVLRTVRFDVVLAQENLPDGRGYELTPAVLESSGSLLVSIALSESCLWLLAAEQGVSSLGERAISPGMLEWEIAGFLNQREESVAAAAGAAPGLAAKHPSHGAVGNQARKLRPPFDKGH
jgi:DNA-binding NtrC family response regulator